MPNDFIEREILFNTLQLAAKASGAMGRHDSAGIYASAASLVAEQPAADVVEVVRCKDCEQYVAGELGYGKCNFFKTAIFSEFYCRYGGKKGRPE